MKCCIVLGTYERLLYGLDFNPSSSDKLETTFIIPAHSGCIHSVAAGGRHLATGGSDDVLKLFDMKKRKENGVISLQNKPFTRLIFWGSKWLFCCNEDGTISIFECKEFENIKNLTASKGFRVNDFGVHPSGNLGFSLSRNKSVILWDLVKGKAVLKSKCHAEPLRISFTKDGSRYAILAADSSIEIFDLSQKSSLKIIEKPSAKLHAFCFLDNDTIVYAGEDKNIYWYSISCNTETSVPSGHKLRIRELDCFSGDNVEDVFLVTASSDGGVIVWNKKITDENHFTFTLFCSHNIDARITGLSLSLL